MLDDDGGGQGAEVVSGGVLAALDELLEGDLDALSDGELSATVLELDAAEARLEAARLRVVAVWDRRVGDAAASRRTPAQLRHDALLEIANRAAAYDPNTGRRATPLMNVTVGLEPMAAGKGIATRTGPPLAAATARRLACSAAMARVLFDPQGQVLEFGRRRRLFTATQAEALFLRFGGCAFPGCDRPPSWCQIHHILEWERDHGPTDLANGVPLCSHHHHCVHEGGFTIKTTEHGLEWFRPDNSIIEPLWLPTAA